MSGKRPSRIPASFHEKVWGVTDLSPWYPPQPARIGEVCFEADLPLLVKFLFTSDRLSVQVHPNDSFGAAHENSSGKTEMWHVLRAEPGAQIALGFREAISLEGLRESALSGAIEKLLRWVDVRAGDTFFIPSGTVHAIGAGVVLCEIQQNSTITYRLYDYARNRELHMDKALAVSVREPSEAGPVKLPVNCEHFQTEVLNQGLYRPDADRFQLLIALEGKGRIAGEPFCAGETWLVPAGADEFLIEGELRMLRTRVP